MKIRIKEKNKGKFTSYYNGNPMHYSRTMTTDNLSKAANTVGQWVLTGLGKVGQVFNGLLTAGASTDFGQTSPFVMSSAKERRAIQRGRLAVLKKANEKIAQGMTWVSPLNYGVALWNGHGLNARKGEEEIASWSPAWLATARLIELGVGPKTVKGIKATPRVVVNTAAKAGVKPARAAVIARKIKLGIKLNTKNGKIEVTEDYFNAPDKWYRVSERPEKIGIELNGKNVTTSDDPGIHGTANGWRESMLSLTGKIIPGKGIDEGYFIFLPRKIGLSKHGAAHGNTSQAAKGLIWLGTFAFSDKFPRGVIEGLAPVKIFRGMNNLGKDSRTNFVLLNWEDVPLGARVGFHTGEMPMSNLGWFLKTKNGTYTYEPIIPEKRITYLPILLLDSPTSLKFFERKPASISEAERAGAAKWDRNFKPKWHVANYPGYLLKGLMKGSRLEKLLSKNGTININLLNAYFNKASQIEKDVTNKILAEKFAGLKTINYNLFKKAVLDELIGKYNRNYNALSMLPMMTTEKMMAYGGDRLGIIKYIKDVYDGAGGRVTTWTLDLPVSFKLFTFETPKIPIGNRKHYSGQPIGHTRTFTNQQEPLILHVMESQSDWAQQAFKGKQKPVLMNQIVYNEQTGLFENPNPIEYTKYSPLEEYLIKNYLQRLLQENLRYAAENGLSKMRYPTSETAAKIEGYHKVALPRPTRNREIELTDLLDKMWKEYYDANESQLNNTSLLELELIGRKNIPNYAKLLDELEQLKSIPDKYEYTPAHKTILKKYADFPKLFLKLYKGLDVKTVTDTKGNTWYEVNVPKGYLNSEWLFNRGAAKPFTTTDDGSLIDLTKRANFTNPDTRYKREDVLIEDEYGTDLYSYPEYIKYRISKLKQIVPDKIKDYTVPKLDPGEINLKKEQLISRDNFIRNNIGFNPMAIMSMGRNLKTHLWEINRRLNKLYPDLPKYATEGINNAENKPFIIGYFNEPNIVGLHSLMRGINLVEPSPKSNLPRTMLHEGVMHGTEPYMTDKIANAYLLFINKIYESPYIENGIFTKNNWSYKAPEGTERWEEGRATFGEIRKFLYDKISKDNNILFSTENMDKLIPIFEKTVDKLSTNDVANLFNKTNGYGEVYGTIGPKANSNFLKDSKDLLKYMPATLPFLIPKKEKKK